VKKITLLIIALFTIIVFSGCSESLNKANNLQLKKPIKYKKDKLKKVKKTKAKSKSVKIAAKSKKIVNNIKKTTKFKNSKKLSIKTAKAKSKNLKTKKKIAKNTFKFKKKKRKMVVTATAYTSHKNQTDSTPFLAAWNNKIRPGMKIIAVSHDLIKKYGLKNGVKVKLKGFAGHFTVRDKMNKRFKKRIDIYMGLNKKRALRWGKRKVVMIW
jgi:3D (Asp-Asp-Asp) domain-containing protein